MANELRIYQNFLGGRIDAALSSSDTTLSSPALVPMVDVGSTTHMLVTLDPDGRDGAPEIVMVTAHTLGLDTATIVRGVEGTTAREHAAGVSWNHGPVASDVAPLAAGWTTYTPTWTGSSGNPALGDGLMAGYFLRQGWLGHIQINMKMGSTTTYGTGEWSWSLPAGWSYALLPSGGGAQACGSAYGLDVGNFHRAGIAVNDAATGLLKVHQPGGGAAWGTTMPHTWGANDLLTIDAHVRLG